MCQGASYRVRALEGQGGAALHPKAYPARAWWVTGAGWGGSSPNLAPADSLQLCGSWLILRFYQPWESPPPACPLPTSLTLTMLLDRLGGVGLGSPATGCSAMSSGGDPPPAPRTRALGTEPAFGPCQQPFPLVSFRPGPQEEEVVLLCSQGVTSASGRDVNRKYWHMAAGGLVCCHSPNIY